MKYPTLLIALIAGTVQAETVLLDCGDGLLIQHKSGLQGISDPVYQVRRKADWEPICNPGVHGGGQLAYREECSASKNLLVLKRYERSKSGQFDSLRSVWAYDFGLYRVSMTLGNRPTTIQCKRSNKG